MSTNLLQPQNHLLFKTAAARSTAARDGLALPAALCAYPQNPVGSSNRFTFCTNTIAPGVLTNTTVK